MVDIVIYEGLKESVKRGQSLKQAMMSFFNAGYKKENIEEAARALQMQQAPPLNNPNTPQTYEQPQEKHFKKISNYSPKNKKDEIKKINQGLISPTKQPNNTNHFTKRNELSPKQHVSNYGIKPKKNTAVIILVIILALLIGTLGSIFIFKNKILDFFDNLNFFSIIFHV